MKKTFKKLLCIILIIMYLLPFFQSVALAAITVPITKANLHDDHKITTNVEFKDGAVWSELECEYICHTVNGKKYPAYCISHRA